MHSFIQSILLCFLLLFCKENILAQNSKEDSLQIILQGISEDNVQKVNTLLQLANLKYGIDPAKMLYYSNQALDISKRIHFLQGEADALRFCGIAYYTKGDFDKTEDFFEKSLEMNRLTNNAKGIVSCLSNLGSVNMVQNKYVQALQFYGEALQKSDAMNDYLISGITYGNIGVIYSEMKDYDKALEHFQGGVERHQKINYSLGVATGLDNIGNIYFKKKAFEKALEYYQAALDINLEQGNKLNQARNYGNLANAELEMERLSDAFNNYQKALEINKELGNKKGTAVILQGLGNYYFRTLQTEKAIEYCTNAHDLAESINILDVQSESAETLSKIYEQKKDFSKAYEYFKLYVSLKEKVDNDNNRKQLLRLEVQNEFTAKEEKYKAQQLLAAEKLKQQQLLLELNNSKLRQSEKEQEIVKLRFLKTQADLQKQQLEAKDNERQLKISEQEKNIEKAKAANLLKEKLLNDLKFKNIALYGLSFILVLLVLGTFLVQRYRIKSLRVSNALSLQQSEQLARELNFKNELKEAEMQTLRSQMNPHFMFNSINSINSFIVQNKTHLASEYLTTFAKLMRSILDNSQHAFIPLAKELETLKWYMELESVRLEHSFDYIIRILDETDEFHFKIPPLILQPFVENAIWHGLHNKTGKGNIDISITTNDDDALVINIQDDGIGRSAAAKLKKHETAHKSYGIDTTVRRVLMLNPGNKVEIKDLVDASGNAAGTEVILIFQV